MLHIIRQLRIMSSYDDKCSNSEWSKCQNINGLRLKAKPWRLWAAILASKAVGVEFNTMGRYMWIILSAHRVLVRSTWIWSRLRVSHSLQWRHNRRKSVSSNQPHDCLLNRLFRRRLKKTSSCASLAFVRGIHRGPVNSPDKWPVTRKMFPFGDVIMLMIDPW